MELLTEKYRPKSLDDLVIDESVYLKIKEYINSDQIPHLLFYGKPGIGKTSLGKVIVNTIDCDFLYINASDENDVNTFRNKVKTFVVTVGFRRWKIVFLDESDNLTHSSMALLRNMMEEFSNHARFILTCNYIEKIIDPIQSRCQLIQLEPSTEEMVVERIEKILTTEGIEFQPSDIQKLVHRNHPDMRRMLNDIEFMTRDGVFQYDYTEQSIQRIDEKVVLVLQSNIGQQEKLNEIRTLVDSHSNQDFPSLYHHLYKNVDLYGRNKIGKIITLLGDGQYQMSVSPNKELGFMNTITKIISVLG